MPRAPRSRSPRRSRSSSSPQPIPAPRPRRRRRARSSKGCKRGQIDRALFTSNANAYFSEQALKDFASSLAPLGAPTGFVQTSQQKRGGMTLRVYRASFPNRNLRVWTFELPDGKLEQLQVAPIG